MSNAENTAKKRLIDSDQGSFELKKALQERFSSETLRQLSWQELQQVFQTAKLPINALMIHPVVYLAKLHEKMPEHDRLPSLLADEQLLIRALSSMSVATLRKGLAYAHKPKLLQDPSRLSSPTASFSQAELSTIEVSRSSQVQPAELKQPLLSDHQEEIVKGSNSVNTALQDIDSNSPVVRNVLDELQWIFYELGLKEGMLDDQCLTSLLVAWTVRLEQHVRCLKGPMHVPLCQIL